MGKIKISLLIIIIATIILVAAAIVLMFGGQPGISGNKIKNLDIAKEIYSFPGEIKEIKGKTLTLAALIPLADLTKGSAKTTIEIKIDDQTKITKLKFPTDVSGDTESVYPEETALTLDDLNVGDNINISSKVNIYDNLKSGADFIATDIFIVEN